MNSIDQFLENKKWALYLALLFAFGLGLAIRLYDLKDAPLDFHPTRQLHSAVMSRGMYYQNLEGVPEWKREMAVRQWKAEGLIEPPFMEWLTAKTYQLTGQENLWYARLYSIIFWVSGGIALFLLAKELSGGAAAVVGLLYYLIIPYGAIASRAFQPDPLMTALIAWALWAMVRWHRTPTWTWVVVAGLLSGLAILSKSVAVFFIGGAWAGLILSRQGLAKSLKDPQVWVLAILTVLPYGIFHIYGVYISGLLESQFKLRFFPQLWLDPVFYLRWKGLIASTVGFEWFLVALLSVFLVREKPYRGLVIGLLLGYFAYGLTLSYHISTHDYYHLPLVPVVAVGLAASAGTLFNNLKGTKWLVYPVLVGIILFGVVTSAWDVRVQLKRMDYRSEITFWERLGEKVGAGASVVGLTHDYGYRLSYWGWITSTNWMTSGDFNYRALDGQEFDMVTLFEEETDGKDFFVVTLLSELESQPHLKKLLYENYPVLEETEEYLVFDIRNRLKKDTP